MNCFLINIFLVAFVNVDVSGIETKYQLHLHELICKEQDSTFGDTAILYVNGKEVFRGRFLEGEPIMIDLEKPIYATKGKKFRIQLKEASGLDKIAFNSVFVNASVTGDEETVVFKQVDESDNPCRFDLKYSVTQ